MNAMKRGILVCGLAALTFGLTAVAAPMDAGAEDIAQTERNKQIWQRKYESLITRVREAQDKLLAGKGSYSKARQRERLRGQYKAEIMEQIQEAETELAEAQAELDAFPEEARRAGVPPGWLREVEDRVGAASPSP